MFVAAVFRIAAMSFTMLAAVVGCVTINHTMRARKRNPTILLTADHRPTPVGGTLDTYLYSTGRVAGIQREGAMRSGMATAGADRRTRVVF